jgi:hypothetical protein
MKHYTRKELQNHFNCYRAGYCELYPLFYRNEKIGYNAGIYGWNYDVLKICYDIVITTGYRNMIGKNLPADCKKILKQVKKHVKTFSFQDYAKKEKYLERKRKEFVKAILAEIKNA